MSSVELCRYVHLNFVAKELPPLSFVRQASAHACGQCCGFLVGRCMREAEMSVNARSARMPHVQRWAEQHPSQQKHKMLSGHFTPLSCRCTRQRRRTGRITQTTSPCTVPMGAWLGNAPISYAWPNDLLPRAAALVPSNPSKLILNSVFT